MTRFFKHIYIFSIASLGLVACDPKVEGCTDSACNNYNEEATKDDGSCACDTTNTYEVPTIYNFTNVDITGQQARLSMLGEMVSYMKKANTPTRVLSADTLKNMFANENNVFSDATLNSAGKQIKNKTYELVVPTFEAYMDSLVAISGLDTAGSNGVAGVVYKSDSSGSYLFNTKGFEYTQLIEKGLFGAFIFNQIANNYLTDAKIGNAVDNVTVEEGKGTAMEHHWDEAFGYFGVPVDFPSNTSGITAVGKYCNGRDALLGSNATIMNAFIKGRAAIANDDMLTKDSMVTIITDEIERVLAASAIHYINDAKANITVDASRNHELSEAVAFIGACVYNPNGKMDASKSASIIAMIGDNLYEVTVSGLDAAKTELSTLYGLDSVKDDL